MEHIYNKNSPLPRKLIPSIGDKRDCRFARIFCQ